MDAKSIYRMYAEITNKYSLEEANEWAEENLTDGEIKLLKAEIKRQAKASKRNWHVQGFKVIEF